MIKVIDLQKITKLIIQKLKRFSKKDQKLILRTAWRYLEAPGLYRWKELEVKKCLNQQA